MEQHSLLKRIINFFKILLITIIGLIKKIFNIQNKKEVRKVEQVNQQNIKEKQIKASSNASLPDTDNIKTNPHNSKDSNDEESTDNIILTLPKQKIETIKNLNNQTQHNFFTQEKLEELIDKELEEVYKEQKLKIKEAPKEIKEQIKEIKKIVIPKINDKIIKENLKEEEVIKEIKKEVKEIIKEKPLFPEIKKEEQKENIYYIAHPKQPQITTPTNNPPKIKKQPIVQIPTTTKINQNILNSKASMIKNTDTIPEPSIKNELKNAALSASIITAASALELIKPTEKAKSLENKEQSKTEIKVEKQTTTSNQIQDEPPIELPILKKVEDEIIEVQEKMPEEIKELAELQEIKEEIDKKNKELDKQEISLDQPTQQKKEEIKEIIRDTEIAAITKTTDSVIEDSKQEIKKEEFENKDYDRIERQIDHMLNDITNTFLRYGDKLTPTQKEKLQREEKKLQSTKEQIHQSKENDIKIEKNLLQGDIHEAEILGLQEELRKMNIEYKEKVSDDLLKRMDKLEGMTREQVANADKRILMKRLNKASLLLEMTSILAFPFIRNKYFFYFTIGLIIDNHFNFINAFWRRKVNKYEPADLSNIKKGQDALNGALDLTFKNIVELDYLEQQAISRYPELAYDPNFISRVTNLRIHLNNQYNKLMRKNKVMEKYYLKTKHQRKILQKEDKKAS